MNRRRLLCALPSLLLIPLLPGCARQAASSPTQSERDKWRRLLKPDAYSVLFEEDTEPAGTSPLNEETRDGTYVCTACHQPLFDSSTKYESGTGWPSFFRPLPDAIGTKTDYKLVFPRTEYHCSLCKGHQGHVFDDGPQPTGKRYCNNGLALRFVTRGETLPPLRA